MLISTYLYILLKINFKGPMQKINSKGFTLIELLIVIAIIAIIAGAVFVALNPGQRFQDTRDARRMSDVASILSAIKLNQVDNKGTYLTAIANAASNTVLMIGSGSSSCNTNCNSVASSGACIDLSSLITAGQIGAIPVSPNDNGSWSSSLTGYTLKRASSTGIITISACEYGTTNYPSGISVTR